MKIQTKQLVIVSVIVIVILGSIYFLLNRQKSSKVDLGEGQGPQVTGGPQKGEKGYNETNTKVTVGTKEIQTGKFVRAEQGKIYYKTSDGFTIESELPADQVALSCYSGQIEGAGQYDFSYVTDVKIYTPETIGTVIPSGEPIIALASSDKSGVYKTHTIGIDASKCPKQ